MFLVGCKRGFRRGDTVARLLRDWRVEYSSEAARRVGPEVRPLWDGRVYFRLRETERDLLLHYRLERHAPTFEIDMRLVAVLPLSGRVGQQRFLLALFAATAAATLGLLLALLALFRPHMRYPRPQQDTQTRDLYFRSLIMVYSAVRRAPLRDRFLLALRQLFNATRTFRRSPQAQSPPPPPPTSTDSSPSNESLLASLRAVNRFPLLVSDQRDVTRPRERRRAAPRASVSRSSSSNSSATASATVSFELGGAHSRAEPDRLAEHVCECAGQCGREEPRGKRPAVGIEGLPRERLEVEEEEVVARTAGEQHTPTPPAPALGSATRISLDRLDSLLDHSRAQDNL